VGKKKQWSPLECIRVIIRMDNQEEEEIKKMKAKQNNGVHRVHEGYQKKEQLWNMGTDQWQPHKTNKCKLK
jgi:hypothetical protein